MKNYCLIFIILIASLIYSSSHAVTIPDANLAAAVCEALNLGPTDPIPQKELEGLESLDAKERDIKDLTGLEEATGLTVLYLGRNRISDLTPLTHLTDLEELSLGQNQINDLTPIAGATQLKLLHFDRNQITDISFIEKFTSLTSLYFRENPIQDMEPLQKLLEQLPDLELDIPAPVELNIQPPPANR